MSVNWNARSYTKEEFVDAWNSSLSIAEVARQLGCNRNGGGYHSLKSAASELGLSQDHMKGQGHLAGKKHTWSRKMSLDELLVDGSYRSSSSLKTRLYNEGVLKKECSICGISTWLDMPAPLALDHINGNNTDNRLENLRILCYNCHGQTETFCRGTKKSKKRKNTQRSASPETYCTCGKLLKHGNKTGLCRDCYNASGLRSKNAFKNNKSKIDWPPDEDLIRMLRESNYLAVGRALGVSDNAVRKHCTRRDLVVD